MKRIVCLLTVAVWCFALVGVANATPNDKLNWGRNTNPASINPPAGAKLVLNLNLQVSNAPDTAASGGIWATDDFSKHIQVWDTGVNGNGDHNFYVDVKFVGTFITTRSTSPEQGAGMPLGLEGTMEGGYQATFTGTIIPGVKMKGNLGSFEYGGLNTPPAFPEAFFNLTSEFNQKWWGWQYRTLENGTWINASTGNAGDIANNCSLCKIVPSVTLNVTPTVIWPPNHSAVAIHLSGTITPQSNCSLAAAFYNLSDEYGADQSGPLTVNPDGSFNQYVYVEAWRNSTDADGRHYSFTVTATNEVGTGTSNTVVVVVPYQQY
jgi:hypothetical protein